MRAIQEKSDSYLLDQCLDGKEEGYSMLYKRYGKGVFNSICRIVVDIHQAEDLLQEVFINVFSDLNKLKEVENMGSWIKRIAINKSISHIRKNKQFFVDIDEYDVEDTSNIDIFEKEGLENRINELNHAIADLPLQSRTIVNLYLFEDMSQEEIGKLLSLSHVAVRSQYRRAKIKIVQYLNRRRKNG